MQQHKSTVRQLFQLMAAHYGNNWNNKWAGINSDDVLNVWSEKLRDYLDNRPQAIQWAIEHLPVHPPGLPEFLQLCKECPKAEPPTGLHYPAKPMPEKLRLIIRNAYHYLHHADNPHGNKLDWARNIMGKLRNNIDVSPAVQQHARQALMKYGEFFDKKGNPIRETEREEQSAHA